MNRVLFSIFFFFFLSFGFAQNGKLISKKVIDITDTPVWNRISENNILKEEFDHLEKLDFFSITYQSDSLVIKGILVEPKIEGVYPVVIFNRGGNRDFAPLNLSTIINYTSKLAEQGYVIIGSNYREKDEFGGEELNDVLNLTETVKEIEKADPNCIGMFGWSRGGIMTYLSLKELDKIKTAIVGNGVTDLFQLIKDRPKMEIAVLAECIPNYYQNKEVELRKRSALYWAEKLNKHSSLLIISGKNDKRANQDSTTKFAEKLSDLKYDFEYQEFITDHFFSNKRKELDELVISWFDKRLKNAD
ncbi:prolyl oligopeptidase family serine peptidase [Maribacter sp. SA7]|uniref:alpha/beta hydrolase family protein n=1 Tax=Maribacter zhoushanensis TaxID=3030012 RepID=UPI0023EBC241|nr:prolyl oligopeptidase family serine peptidase [Maribacter zhoushanensis]MDF4202169.1 prolyl oligopeptidase family serine peptidase [Maribacter zhoushanensis]